MHRTISAFVAAAVAALTTTAAFAADVYRPPLIPAPAPVAPIVKTSFWNGHYLGLQTGYARDNANFTAPGETVDFGTFPARGWLFGGRLGFDRTYGHTVLGVVGDLNYGNVTADVIDLGGGGSDVHAKVDWLGTLRVRAGFVAANHLLLYGTAGVAFAHTRATVTDLSGGGVDDAGSDSATHIGWTAGAGAEVALSDHMSLFAEWLYTDYGRQSYHFENPIDASSFVDAETGLTGNTVLVGLNLRFR